MRANNRRPHGPPGLGAAGPRHPTAREAMAPCLGGGGAGCRAVGGNGGRVGAPRAMFEFVSVCLFIWFPFFLFLPAPVSRDRARKSG